MGFDTKAFLGYFLNEQAGSMERRREKADIFEEEERQEAEQSRREIQRRRTIVDGLVSESKRLEQLGVTPAQIKAATASGPQGLMNLSKAVQAEVKARGGMSRLSEYDISALIDASAISPAYDKMDYREFLSRTMGLTSPDQTPEVDDRTMLQKALGFDQKKAIRAKLDAQKTAGGYSVLDVNEMARGQAYSSLMPGAYATFSPGSLYDSESALKSYTLAASKINKALDEDPVYLNLKASGDTAAMQEYRQNAFKPFALAQFKKYGMASAKDPVLNWSSVIGEANYKTLLQEIPDGSKQIVADFENQLGETREITETGPNGQSYTLTIGAAGVTKLVLTPAPGTAGQPKTLTDQDEINSALNKFNKAGLMDTTTLQLLQEGQSTTDLPSGVASDEVVDRTMPTGLGASDLGDAPAVDVDSITAPETADEFKVNGVTYDEWQGMSRKERKDKGLPQGELGAQFKFKRFQKGLGINTAADQSVATFANMGKAQTNIASIEEDAVVTIGDMDYKVKTFDGEKYFEELDTGSMQEKDVDVIFRSALKGILEEMRGKDLEDFPFILQDYAFDNDLPDDVVNRLGEEYDTIEAKLRDAGL